MTTILTVNHKDFKNFNRKEEDAGLKRKQEPKTGDSCLARYTDDVLYRAKVTAVTGNTRLSSFCPPFELFALYFFSSTSCDAS